VVNLYDPEILLFLKEELKMFEVKTNPNFKFDVISMFKEDGNAEVVVLPINNYIGWLNSGNGICRTTAYVNLEDLPLDTLIEWSEVNPRAQNKNGKQVKSIITGLEQNPELFVHKNLGVNILVEKARIIDKEIVLKLYDPSIEGVVNGGHTLVALKMFKELHPEQAKKVFVMLNISYGKGLYEKSDTIVDIAVGLNTCEKVPARDIDNMQGEYDTIKELLKKEPYFSRIVFRSNEEDNDKKLTVGNILSLMYIFDQRYWPDDHGISVSQPTDAYNSKKHTSERHKKYMAEFGWSKDNPFYCQKYILTKMVRIYDYINKNLPEWYSQADATRYGALVEKRGANTNATRRASTTLFLKNKCTSYVSQVPVVIIFSSLRALLIQNASGFYTFKTDPFAFLDKHGPELAKDALNSISGYKSYAVAAKEPIVWSDILKVANDLAK
jgi:hypothetical protein